jgi:hypothetical protein
LVFSFYIIIITFSFRFQNWEKTQLNPFESWQ